MIHAMLSYIVFFFFFFFQAEDGIRDVAVTGVQTCALPIYLVRPGPHRADARNGPDVQGARAAGRLPRRLRGEAALPRGRAVRRPRAGTLLGARPRLATCDLRLRGGRGRERRTARHGRDVAGLADASTHRDANPRACTRPPQADP